MHSRVKLILAAAVVICAMHCQSACAAQPDDLKGVLDRLNKSAANFHSTSANVEFDDITTEPIYDKDIFKGLVYYDRKGTSFRMGVHFNQHNNRPSTKAYTFVDGVLKLHESGNGQVSEHPVASKYESYILLGFGASGTDLAAKWDITLIGWETIDGVRTAQLELVAKDAAVRKNLPKVNVWIDPDRAVSLKQIFTLSGTSSKECYYTNFKLNAALPANAFNFAAESQTEKH